MKVNKTNQRFVDGILVPREGWPDEVSFDAVWADSITVEDVHEGLTTIWRGMAGTLFCDIDGTVADLEHRRVFLEQLPKKDYASFEKTMHLDKPIPAIISAVQSLYEAGWTVVMCTGRSARNIEVTEQWLRDHGVPYHAIYTRAEFEIDPATGEPKMTKRKKPKPDHRKDSVIKAELLAQARKDGFNPDIVFDDRNQVVEMWRELDVPCVQVAFGDF